MAVSLLEGIGGVVAVFKVDLREAIGNGQDRSLWVVVGDLPSVYLVMHELNSGHEVLDLYCELMEDWVHAVRSGADMSGVFPFAVEVSGASADMLEARIAVLLGEVLETLD